MSELIIDKNFAAKPEAVFAFVTQKDHLLKWWGPEGITIAEHDLDFTRLGPWSSIMVNANGQRYKVTGEVTLIDDPNAVELTWGWHDDNDERGHNSSVRFEVKSNGQGGTHFRLIHSNLPDDESAENHNSGWSSSFKKLERLAA